MPTENITCEWLNKKGKKLAPKTLLSQVQLPDGSKFEDKYNEDTLNNIGRNYLEEKIIRLDSSSNVGYINYATGLVNNSTNARHSGMIDITDCLKIEYCADLGTNGAEIAFYDKNKKYLKEISNIGSGMKTKSKILNICDPIYNKVKYAIISVYSSKLIFNDAFIKLYPKINSSNLIKESDINIYIPDNKNHFNKQNVIIGKEVYRDGTIKPDKESVFSNYIKCHNKNSIFITGLPIYDGFDRYTYFYNENKEPIGSYLLIRRDKNEFQILIPTEAYYIAFSIYQRWKSGDKDYSSIMVTFDKFHSFEPYIEYLSSIKNYPIYNDKIIDKKTKNMKMIIFGDSITETARMDDDGSNYIEDRRTNWLTFAKTYLQTFNFINYAKSGATFKDQPKGEFRQSFSNQIKLAIQNKENKDVKIIIVSLGTNDGSVSLGDYNTAMSKQSLDDLDKNILYESIRYGFWSLRKIYPNAICFCATPIQKANNDQPIQLIEAITKMANRYNFIIIDALNESGIIKENEIWQQNGQFLEDGLHPNKNGAERLGRLYASKILNYFEYM